MLRDCGWSSRFWFLSSLGLNVENFTDMNFANWLFSQILPKGSAVIEKAIILA